MSRELFQPIKIGNLQLLHKIVLAPLTRRRGDDSHNPSDLAIEYYKQRADSPGTLLITEGTYTSPEVVGYTGAPGIYTETQINAWKKIVAATHEKGSFAFVQLFQHGRSNEVLDNPNYRAYAPSAIPLGDAPAPHAVTKEEIKSLINDYKVAAENAIKAGFDGVEIHAANGYLLNEFLDSGINHRTDEYGGSLENRARFLFEILELVIGAIGIKKVGVRLSPFSTYQGTAQTSQVDIHSYVVERLARDYPDLAFLHLVEAFGRNSGNLDFAVKLWAPRPIIFAGGYTPETAEKRVKEVPNSLVAFGQSFIPNPDLVERIRKGASLREPDSSTFYTGGPNGYTSYAIEYSPDPRT